VLPVPAAGFRVSAKLKTGRRLHGQALGMALRPDLAAGDRTVLRAIAVPLFEALRRADVTIAVLEVGDRAAAPQATRAA
jgi:hypothetical protein